MPLLEEGSGLENSRIKIIQDDGEREKEERSVGIHAREEARNA